MFRATLWCRMHLACRIIRVTGRQSTACLVSVFMWSWLCETRMRSGEHWMRSGEHRMRVAAIFLLPVSPLRPLKWPFCLIFVRTAQWSVLDGTNGLSSSEPCAYCRIVQSSACVSSVCLSSVTFCIVAKQYVSAKNCLKERIGNQSQKVAYCQIVWSELKPEVVLATIIYISSPFTSL